MIRYGELVDYIKRNHINWDTELFEVLRGFFDERNTVSAPSPNNSIQQGLIFPKKEFKEPEDGEYTSDDLLNLFNS